MYQKPSAPQPIGGVLDDTLQLYKASFASCWVPALLVSLIGAAFSYYIMSNLAPAGGLNQPNAALAILSRYKSLGPGYNWGNLAVSLVTLLFYGQMVTNVVAVARGQTPAFGSSLSHALRRLPAMVGASILFLIALVVGFCLLIIPGFYVLNRLQLFLVPLIAESEGPVKSLSTSWHLVGGNWWRTLSVVGVLFIILLVLEILLGSLTGVVGVFIGGRPTDAAQTIARISLATILIGVVIRVFTAPLICAVGVSLYHDLLLRKGGGDLQARLGALPQHQ